MAWYHEPAKPAWELIGESKASEWLRIEKDDPANIYITGLAALNLPTGPLGDWHGALWRPLAGTGQSTRTKANEQLCRLGIRLWNDRELVDARLALQAIGHPRGDAQAPVWAASHARAVAEMVIQGLLITGTVHDPDDYSVRRWLVSEQRTICAEMLEQAKAALATDEQRERLDEWKSAICASAGLHEADSAK